MNSGKKPRSAGTGTSPSDGNGKRPVVLPTEEPLVSISIEAQEVQPLVAGLLGGIDVDGGPTDEQLTVLGSIVSDLWQRSDLDLGDVAPLGPGGAAAALVRPEARLRFCEMLMTLELCRHPQSKHQVESVEAYVSTLGISGIEIQTTREALEVGADQASTDLERFYGEVLPEISEVTLRDRYLHLAEPDHQLGERLRSLHDLPEGTLGHAYIEFYRRNNLTLPGDDIHLPAHYVNHDMNHVITGYEPTAPGEIARSGFLMAANESRRNWLEFLMTMSIHETGVLNHGNIRAKVATLDREGVPELFGEGLERGSRCTTDLSQVDHLAIAERPLDQVREQFNVVPLAHPTF
jgi:ubiquinone biosynthesis protein Coq4